MTHPQNYFYNTYIYMNTGFTNIYKRVLPVLKSIYDKSICYFEVYYVVALR